VAIKRSKKIRGFYGVIDANDEYLTRRLSTAASVIQVRMKHASRPGIAQAARMARRITQAAGVLLIVNDHLDIAVEVGADGVHLGQNDIPLARARERVRNRPNFLIGVSTHDLEQVKLAVASGADYVGFGPVYFTQTKENAEAARGIDLLREAVVAAGEVPIVAIGGISPERAREVAATGAAAACAISSVNKSRSPEVMARAIAAAWQIG
jgi:thiamine-phosphate pyrophosphorylase